MVKNISFIIIASFLFTQISFAQSVWDSTGTNIYFTGGNVGIGKSSPLTNLHISSGTSTSITWPLWVENPYNTETIFGYGVGLKLKLSHNGELNKWAGIAVVQESSWANSTGLALYANETERLRIDAAGQMGIRTTDPTTSLEVFTDTQNAAKGIDISQGNDSGNRNSGRLFFSNKGELSNSFSMVKTGDTFSIRSGATPNSSSGTARLTVKNDGNIGIGEGNPSRLLHVNGSTIDVISAFESTDSGTQIALTDNSGSLRLGTLSNGAFALSVGGDASSTTGANVVEAIRVNSVGEVGIGTTSPGAKLHLNGTGGFDSGYIISNSHDQVNGYFNYDTNNSPYLITYAGTGAAEVELQSDGDVILAQAGNVGIGTAAPGNKLEVNGTIRSKEVIVEATGWPDYVFGPEYELLTLEEIEAHIKSKGHLPEVPSAKEVEEEGQHLGEMQQLLLKKIEELTLHVIELKKQNDAQQKEIEALKEN